MFVHSTVPPVIVGMELEAAVLNCPLSQTFVSKLYAAAPKEPEVDFQATTPWPKTVALPAFVLN